MRMMLRWTVPVERGNQAIKDGTLARTIQALLEELKPEAAYFWPENGKRAGDAELFLQSNIYLFQNQYYYHTLDNPLELVLDTSCLRIFYKSNQMHANFSLLAQLSNHLAYQPLI